MEQKYEDRLNRTDIDHNIHPAPAPPRLLTASARSCSFRFYATLNHFLPPNHRQKRFTHVFDVNASIKDLIEAIGVPHPEVELILVNEQAVDFSYLVQDGDRISVYPRFQTIDISSLLSVGPEPLPEPRFILDVHLGRLANYLRMLGFDTLYRNDYADEELAEISSSQQRILLTRDRGLLKRSIVTYGYCLRETNPRRQVVEVLRHFDLFELTTPFQRCVHCNGLLQPVDKQSISHRLPPKIRQYYDTFRHCPYCDRVYWPGSHYERMQGFIERILYPSYRSR